MQLFKSARALTSVLKNIKPTQTIGFVPTMGCLHSGHLQLVKAALLENEVVVVSIFVNKRQFNNATDFEKYPQTLDSDVALLHTISDNILVYAPETANELFPTDFNNINLNLHGIESRLEGEHRPGHFQGVIDVVHQFFDQIQPTRAYFGEKDFQQLAIIRLLQVKYFPQLIIVGIETSRAPSGLALSSRNIRLSEQGLILASELYKSLTVISNNFTKQHQSVVTQEIARLNSLGFEIDYISVAHEGTLNITTEYSENNTSRVFAAVFIEGVRLIDNVLIKA